MIFPLVMTIVALTFLLCFLCGAAWTINRRIPLIATAVIVGGYLVFVGAVGIWVAQCWQCSYGTDDTRNFALFAAVGLGWMVPAVLVGTVLVGMTVGAFVDAATSARRWQASRARLSTPT